MATTGKASELERGDQSGAPPNEAFELGASPSDQPSDVKETWKHPRSNILKTIACFWSFAIAGLNDGAYGVRRLTPALTRRSRLRLNTLLMSCIGVVDICACLTK